MYLSYLSMIFICACICFTSDPSDITNFRMYRLNVLRMKFTINYTCSREYPRVIRVTASWKIISFSYAFDGSERILSVKSSLDLICVVCPGSLIFKSDRSPRSNDEFGLVKLFPVLVLLAWIYFYKLRMADYCVGLKRSNDF